jgi:4-hydroxy-tetrahydrodipicolinate synthase
MRLFGVYTALVTPFSGGELDEAALIGLVDRQLDAGVAGLVPCGTTGEAATLTDTEWARVISITVARSKGRAPVIAGCGSNSTARTVESVRAAAELGADAALVVFPYYNKPNPPGMAAHVAAVAAVGLPVVLYHVPGRTAQRLPVGQLGALCNTPGVIGVKEATGDVAYGQDLMERTDVALLSGDDFTFAALMAMGAQGVISVLSNLAPKMTVAWAQAAATGDLPTQRALLRRCNPLVHALFNEVNPVPAKAGLAAMGLLKNELRLPLAPGADLDPALLAGLE